MAGESWRQYFQIGKESVVGTPVAATRKMYGTGGLTKEVAINLPELSTGTRDQVRDGKKRATVAGGTFNQPLSVPEIIELLLGAVQGGVTPIVTGGVAVWSFNANSATLDNQTWEWYDGQRGWQGKDVNIDQLKITGNANGDATVTTTLFATDAVGGFSMTGSLTDRAVNFVQGWETKIYIDPFGGTPGTTNIPHTGLNYTISVMNGLGRKYFLDNTAATGAITIGKLGATLEVLMEANTLAYTEVTNRDSAVKRMVRLEIGNNTGITVPIVQSIVIDTPGAYTVAPTGVTFTGGGGSGATGTVQTTGTSPNITVTGVTVTAGGTGYTSAPAIAFTGGTGTAATAHASMVSATNHKLWVDIPCIATVIDLTPEDNGTKAYKMTYSYITDPTNGFPIKFTVTTDKATAY